MLERGARPGIGEVGADVELDGGGIGEDGGLARRELAEKTAIEGASTNY